MGSLQMGTRECRGWDGLKREESILGHSIEHLNVLRMLHTVRVTATGQYTVLARGSFVIALSLWVELPTILEH